MVRKTRPTLLYLECPSCGARYLARQQDRDAPEDKPRWFTCSRCEKRVMSVQPLRRPAPVDVQHA